MASGEVIHGGLWNFKMLIFFVLTKARSVWKGRILHEHGGEKCVPVTVPKTNIQRTFSLLRLAYLKLWARNTAVRTPRHTHIWSLESCIHKHAQQCLIKAVRVTRVVPPACCSHASLHSLLRASVMTMQYHWSSEHQCGVRSRLKDTLLQHSSKTRSHNAVELLFRL